MRSSLHLAVLLAILPGIIFPGTTALCFCAATDCESSGSCCAPRAAAPEASCCGGAAPHSCSKNEGELPAFTASKRCSGCVVVVPHTPTSPTPQKHARALISLTAVVVTPVLVPEVDVVASRTSLVRPKSNAPPERCRSLPLVI